MVLNLDNFRFVIFDVERTLINNQKIIGRMLDLISRKKNYQNLCKSRTGIKLLFPENICNFFTYLPWLTYFLDSLFLNFFNFFDRKRINFINKGVDKVLFQLNKRNCHLFASSGNYTKKVVFLLEKTGIANYFTLILGAENIQKTEHIPYFASLVGLPLEEFSRKSLFFGDMISDIIIGQRYGIYTVGVNYSIKMQSLLKNAGAKEVISNFEEVIII